jgi:hypothetical protein
MTGDSIVTQRKSIQLHDGPPLYTYASSFYHQIGPALPDGQVARLRMKDLAIGPSRYECITLGAQNMCIATEYKKKTYLHPNGVVLVRSEALSG